MNKSEVFMSCLVIIAFLTFVAGSAAENGKLKLKSETDRIVSCNNLKAVAIAASAPEPTCANVK